VARQAEFTDACPLESLELVVGLRGVVVAPEETVAGDDDPLSSVMLTTATATVALTRALAKMAKSVLRNRMAVSPLVSNLSGTCPPAGPTPIR